MENNVTPKDGAKERVYKELEDLNEKIVKLSAFLFSEKAIALSERMQKAMCDQLSTMQEYAKVLMYRIQIWGKTDKEIYQSQQAALWY